MLQDADGHVLTSVTGLAPGDPVSVRVAGGRVHATTARTEPDPDSSTTADPSDPEEHDEQAG